MRNTVWTWDEDHGDYKTEVPVAASVSEVTGSTLRALETLSPLFDAVDERQRTEDADDNDPIDEYLAADLTTGPLAILLAGIVDLTGRRSGDPLDWRPPPIRRRRTFDARAGGGFLVLCAGPMDWEASLSYPTRIPDAGPACGRPLRVADRDVTQDVPPVREVAGGVRSRRAHREPP